MNNMQFLESHKSVMKTSLVTDHSTNKSKYKAVIRKKDGSCEWAFGESEDQNTAQEMAVQDARNKGGPPEREETNIKLNALASENAALAKQIEDLTKAAQLQARTAEAVETKTARNNK